MFTRRNQLWAEIVREYRNQLGLSQEELAVQLGISRNYLSQIERGKARNISFNLALKILNLGEQHGKVEVILPRRVMVDASIAPEIVWLNHCGVITESSCQGPPAMALIKPSSVERAKELGYEPEYLADVGLFEIRLRS
jgi:transcriptional regulator with XRE-family HTH domain